MFWAETTVAARAAMAAKMDFMLRDVIFYKEEEKKRNSRNRAMAHPIYTMSDEGELASGIGCCWHLLYKMSVCVCVCIDLKPVGSPIVKTQVCWQNKGRYAFGIHAKYSVRLLIIEHMDWLRLNQNAMLPWSIWNSAVPENRKELKKTSWGSTLDSMSCIS